MQSWGGHKSLLVNQAFHFCKMTKKNAFFLCVAGLISHYELTGFEKQPWWNTWLNNRVIRWGSDWWEWIENPLTWRPAAWGCSTFEACSLPFIYLFTFWWGGQPSPNLIRVMEEMRGEILMTLPIRKVMFYWDASVYTQGWIVHFTRRFLTLPCVFSLFLVFKGGGGRVKNELYGFIYIWLWRTLQQRTCNQWSRTEINGQRVSMPPKTCTHSLWHILTFLS